ncbi:hypothetical protein IEO21_04938 [Rhodonia placenta]|uniref:Uncharacterized protein n=1 Tax=Rhodonia placenta TaxID=104341 RepID=A0A8H7U219_9APHY|nr:hypothetical protein IEO21_04938 [Postia placenta]
MVNTGISWRLAGGSHFPCYSYETDSYISCTPSTSTHHHAMHIDTYNSLFMLLSAVNVVLVNVHANDNLDVGIVFIAPLTSIIVSRFFLNLQEVGQSSHVYLGPETGMEASSGDTTESQEAHEMTTIGFADGTQIAEIWAHNGNNAEFNDDNLGT